MKSMNLFFLVGCLSATLVFGQESLYSEGLSVNPFLRPDLDVFYFAPENISEYANGEIIRWRRPPNPLTYVGSYSDAWQIVFKSLDTNNESVAIATTLIKPCDPKPDQLISYQYPEDAAFIGCANSFLLQQQLVFEGFEQMLEAGFYLNIPDYEGMNSSFGAVVLAAQASLDSIKAVISLTEVFGLTSETRTVLWGYSNGSLTSGWAGQIWKQYAPGLHIVAVILGGFVASIKSVLLEVNGDKNAGYLFGVLAGWATQYPAVASYVNYLHPNTSQEFLRVLTLCRDETLEIFQYQNLFDYFTVGQDILSELHVDDIAAEYELGNSPISAPMMIYTGTEDDATPIDASDAGVSRYCNLNTSVTYYRIEGLDHNEAETAGFPIALDFASSALAGLKATQVGCTTINTSLPTSISTPSATGIGCGSPTASTTQSSEPT